MKKGLSILLIAAALFGFYGGAVNLQDVLACMKYWEKEGEKSTADMNKLEDGLKQLQDNEQAYLDGQVQLADGEMTLADGEAQYAQGLADYAAAPGKLAAGKAELSEGYDSYKNLIKLMKGLNKAKTMFISKSGNHQTYWHEGFAYEGTAAKQYMDGGLKTTRGVIKKLLNTEKDTVNLIEAKTPYSGLLSGINDASSYKSFDKAVLNVSGAFGAMKTALEAQAKNARSIDPTELQALVQLAAMPSPMASEEDPNRKMGDEKVSFIVSIAGKLPVQGVDKKLNGLVSDMQAVQGNLDAVGGLELKKKNSTSKTDATTTIALTMAFGGKTVSDDLTLNELIAIAGGVAPNLSSLADILEFGANLLGDYKEKLDAWDSGYNKLVAGKADLASTTAGVPYAFTQMLTNSTVKRALKQYDKSLIKSLKKYSKNRLKNDSLDQFDSDMVTISTDIIPRSLKVLNKVKASASKQLADGEKQLAQGKKDYAAAPAKLADAERQLADGRQQLEDGKKQLAQYEDGEQQVRDGLATLMSTEPSGGLESILDRRDGDDDFDNGDEHLDLAEGLEAVDVGRGYQADSGDLITAELVKRGAGTAAGIAAGVLALLAALMSFLKKNKGAAISGCIAAIAAAGGAAVGTSAGTEFSAQAGSTVGMLPWAAAGILAGIAVVFAIVHFSNPKEAK